MPPGAGNTHERALPLGTGNGNLKMIIILLIEVRHQKRKLVLKRQALSKRRIPASDAKPTLTQDQLNLLNSALCGAAKVMRKIA